jgi:two-component sensor histidine kinase
MVLPLQAHSRSNFALRIKSRDVLSVSLLLRSEAAALQRLAQEYAWLGLYGGAVVAIALFNLGVGIAARYRSSLDYSLYIAAAGMFYASVLGVWSLWPAVPPAIGAMMVPLWVGVALLSGARFSERFLQAGSIFPSSRLLFALFSWLGALIAGISFIDEGSWAARAASVVAPLFVLYTLGVSLLLVRERRRAAVYYAIAVLLPTLGIVLNGLRNFGIIADGLWSSRGNLIGSVMEFSVLSVALVQRIAQGERERMRAQREADAAQKLAVESRLRTLQAQIHPHFLFNALNSLVSLIAEDGRRAEKMVGDLARIFRSSLEASVRKTVRLSEELAMVEAYLSIQKVRLGQRLVYTITTEGPVEKLWVVGQLIQPLVENSIKHAIAPLIGGGHIEVQCRVVEQELVVRVWDSGPGFNNLETAVGAGHGLANVAERLRLTYAGAASLQLSNQQGAVVTLHLPRREQA